MPFRTLVRSPLGLLLLEYYCKLVTHCDTLQVDLEKVQELENGVAAFLEDLQGRGDWKETDLTKGLQKVLSSTASLGLQAECIVNHVEVYDWDLDAKETRKRVDIAFAKLPPALQGTGTTATGSASSRTNAKTTNTSVDTANTTDAATHVSSTTNCESAAAGATKAKDEDTLNVRHSDIVGILEASLDDNDDGGLRKVAHGEYAGTFLDMHKFTGQRYRVVWTLHVNRGPTKQEETTTRSTGITSNTAAAAATATARASSCTESSTNAIDEETIPEDASTIGADDNDNGSDGAAKDTAATSNAKENDFGGEPGQKENKVDNKSARLIMESLEVHVYLCELSWDEDKGCVQSRYSLVWRDFARREDSGENPTLINKGSRFIALAVVMVLKLVQLLDDLDGKVNRRFPDWTPKGPNCARTGCVTCTTATSSGSSTSSSIPVESQSHSYMYKVFDNRKHPTARSPYMWVEERLCDPWFNVEPFLFFHEGHLVPARGGSSRSFVYVNGDTDQSIADVKRTIRDLSEDGRGQGKNASNATDSSGSELVTRQQQTQTPIRFLLGNSRPKRKDNGNPRIPFGQGTIVVLRYKYAAGQHRPSGTVQAPNEFFNSGWEPASPGGSVGMGQSSGASQTHRGS